MKIFVKNRPIILENQFDFVNSVFEKDIKLAFQYEDTFYKEELCYLKMFDIPVIGGGRLDKIQQNFVLNKYKIKTPETFYNKKTFKPFNNINEFDSFCELKEFVVKPICGARGLGVKKVDRKQYKEMIEYPHKNVQTVFKKELELQREFDSDIEETYIQDQFNSGNIIIQKEIDVNREFRLICFPNDSLIYERKKGENQFLGNLSHGSTPIPFEEAYLNELDSFILTKIRKMMKDYKYPWLSVDLYVDEVYNVGVFEFQMEFAYEGFQPKDVRNKMEAALKTFIK